MKYFSFITLFKKSSPGQIIAVAVLIAMIVIYTAVVYQHAVGRYTSYHAGGFDLGNMDQAVWNTLHGHPFRFTNAAGYPPTRLFAHVEPILLPISLLYLIHSGPETLIFLQTVALALGSIPLFLFVRRKLPQVPIIAFFFVGAYLLSSAVLGEALFDFHPVTLATPLLLLTIWAMDTRRYRIFAVAALLAAFCKEEVALSLIPLGLFIAFYQKQFRLGITVALLSFIWVILCFFVILPYFNGTGFSIYSNRYTWMGADPNQIAGHIFDQSTFTEVSTDGISRMQYLILLLLTGGGFSIFAPLFLIPAIPELLINVLSEKPQQFSGFLHYNAVIVPFLMAASVMGAAKLYQSIVGKGVRSYVVVGIIIASLVITTACNLIAVRKNLYAFWVDHSQPRTQREAIDALLVQIPQSASVTTTPTLNPHVSNRYTLYLISDPNAYTADYIGIDLADPTWQDRHKAIYQNLIKKKKYHLVGAAGDVVLLQRR